MLCKIQLYLTSENWFCFRAVKSWATVYLTWCSTRTWRRWRRRPPNSCTTATSRARWNTSRATFRSPSATFHPAITSNCPSTRTPSDSSPQHNSQVRFRTHTQLSILCPFNLFFIVSKAIGARFSPPLCQNQTWHVNFVNKTRDSQQSLFRKQFYLKTVSWRLDIYICVFTR